MSTELCKIFCVGDHPKSRGVDLNKRRSKERTKLSPFNIFFVAQSTFGKPPLNFELHINTVSEII